MQSRWEATNKYKLIITRRSASEVLLLANAAALKLPQVETQPQRRIAEQLTTEVKTKWGLETYCLSFPVHSEGEHVRYAVMESVRHNDEAPTGTCWTPRASAADGVKPQESKLIRQSHEELDGFMKDEKAGPFAKPGWLRELFLWTQQQLAPLDLRITGGFRQLNAGPTFSLIRLETDGGDVWFKATGKPSTHELPATLALASLFPRFVPRVLGFHRAWNGWLAAEVSGASLGETTNTAAWQHAAETLAELQIASIGQVTELLNAQLKDLRIPKLAEWIDPFVARMSELMAVQEKPTPAPLVDNELRTLAERLKDACALLESLGLPDTVGHIDLNPENILVSENRCVFLDWAEGCVTNPFVTFEYLVEHMSRSGLTASAVRERLASGYLFPWTSLYAPEVLRRALALSPLIAVFVYAVAGNAWRSPNLIHDSILAGSFRSLTRRMHRESIHAAVGSELCLD